MPDATPPRPDRRGSPSVAEIAALTARLRRLSDAGTRADDGDREAFLADKNALLDRIAAAEQPPAGHAANEAEWQRLGSARLDLPAPATEPATAAGWDGPHMTVERAALADRAMAEALARHGIDLTGDVHEVEQSRRDQLNQWATADQTADTAVDDDSRVRDDKPTSDGPEEAR